MAVTEVRLGADDIAGCVALSAAAGWNQNAADWRLMLELGEGWGLQLRDGTLVASTLVIPYGSFAWVSMAPLSCELFSCLKLEYSTAGGVSARQLNYRGMAPKSRWKYREIPCVSWWRGVPT